MAVLVSFVLISIAGLLPYILAGNQCSTQFPGRGYCIGNAQYCPIGSTEYTPLSNGIGCPSMSARCCLTNSNTGNQKDRVTADDRTKCGMGSLPLSSRIFNGINTGPCDWPFVVSIRSKLRNASQLDYFGTKHLCAGVLVDRQWVLTSAVCILNAAGTTAREARYRAVVVAGEYNISGIDIYPQTGRQQEQIINIERAIIHPSYAYNHYEQIQLNNPKEINSNGVGLIKLAQPIDGRCSGVICLPTESEATDNCAGYNDCVITGWGFTTQSYSPPQGILDQLKQGRVKIASKKGCDLVVGRLGLANDRPAGTMCQSPDLIQTDGCLGDEGGAVMCSTGGSNWVVRGILPFNIMCKEKKFSLFATDVSLYVSWIRQTMSYWGTFNG